MAAVSLMGQQTWNEQARTLLKKARAAHYASGLDEAETMIRRSLEANPGNFEARKFEVEVLLAQHRFADALEPARKLNRENPDDVQAWGLVSDAALGLGDYAEAERSAQWMLNLRATSVGGLERGARLRELFGDIEGARELWESALRLSLPGDEERAWILTQAASLDRRFGRSGAAEKELHEAMATWPGYQPALAQMARLRVEQRKYDEALKILEDRFRTVRRPDAQYELARVLQLAGRTEQAEAAYREFEAAALAVIGASINYNRELIFYYTDHQRKPAEALRIAKLEAGRRQDVETLDAYAWALYASGDAAEARKQMDKVLALGVREPAYLQHADTIGANLKDALAAAR